MARKAKAETRPAIERLPNVTNVQSVITSIAETSAKILDSDNVYREIVEKAGNTLPQEILDDIREKYIGTAFAAQRENTEKLGPMIRVGVKAMQETGNAKILAKMATWMIEQNLFPLAKDAKEEEEKKEEEKEEGK